MSYTYTKNKKTESKRCKRQRIFIAVLYFIQVVLTTFPFVWMPDGSGDIKEFTAFQLAIQPGGYDTVEVVKLAMLFGVFVLFPAVCFFFYILDKSVVKSFVSIACCLTCACLITFGIGATIAMGAVVALLLYVLILFFTTQNLLTSFSDDK